MNAKLAAARAALAVAEDRLGISSARTDGYAVPRYLSAVFPRGVVKGQAYVASGSPMLPYLLAGAAAQAGAWVAMVGIGNVSWSATDACGIERERLAYIPHVDSFGPQVISALVDSFDVLLVGEVGMSSRQARSLERRVRSRGKVVIAPRWPEGENVSMHLASVEGLRDGRGHISSMDYDISSQFGHVRVSYARGVWAEKPNFGYSPLEVVRA
ncbi:hypothetical protein J2S49_000033 [Arcanobacterium wilhelmae]|uniref:Uncharacterized protein n=1 Tax=Arcanobacterium wilhelmae TaxID=1803177 RepID=A0ABT9N8C8_9ACTO|nr:hypothetical protein [Arcanobacterium wilhelmae]MDP9799957.1 hypothetical protein [Arcanobacterium wilhelmae]WFN91091.1 hypothetical protein P8A24_04380 [Arcanobacterium wilhelmae]